MNRPLCALALAATLTLIHAASPAPPTAPSAKLTAKPEAIAAWKDLRFGMFICWGPVTLTGREIG